MGSIDTEPFIPRPIDSVVQAATPNNGVIKIGFEYHSTLNRWVCVALAGYFV